MKLAITTLDISNPTLLATDNKSGIADSGSSGFYFCPHAPVNNYDATAPTIEVQVADGTPVQSISSAKLALVPDISASSQVGHVVAGFPHSLIGLASFVDMGCQVIFTNTSLIAFDQDSKALLVGWRETTSPRVGEKLPGHDCGAGPFFHNNQFLPAYLWYRGYLRHAHMTPNLMPLTDCTT